jgi:hypothetical protein
MATPSKITVIAETFTVPLNKLSLYVANVRRANAETDIEALADNIAAEGLLQNLGVFRWRTARVNPQTNMRSRSAADAFALSSCW